MTWVLPRLLRRRSPKTLGSGASVRRRAATTEAMEAAPAAPPATFVFADDDQLVMHAICLRADTEPREDDSYRAARLDADRLTLALKQVDADEVTTMSWKTMRQLIAICRCGPGETISAG